MKVFVALPFLAVFALLAAPAFAAGNLTVQGANLAPSFINTNVTTAMLNLSLNSTVNTTNITAINITILGVNASTNISSVVVWNSTNHTQATSITMNSTTNKTTISISTAIGVNTSANNTILIAITLFQNASIRSAVAVNISASTEIGVDSGSNVTITNSSLQSGNSQIQDVHANATVTPLYIDTGIINQSMIYTFTPAGRDAFSNISITIPVNYTIVNVTEVKQGSSVLYNDTVAIVTTAFNRTSGVINLTNTASGGFGTSGAVAVNISINASSTAVTSLVFNSTLTGSNISGALPNVTGSNTTAATQQLVNITNVTVSKGTALANSADFWEFNFTMNFTANVSGILQFKLTNWNNTASQTIALQNGTSGNISYYASLRDGANSTKNMNVTNEYNLTQGVSLFTCCTTTAVYTLVLKMIIPAGTPSSASWFATYGAIFRSS